VDTVLWAVLVVDDADWEALRQQLKSPSHGSVGLPLPVLQALDARPPGETKSSASGTLELDVFDATSLAGPYYPSGAHAARIEGGVLVWATTM